MPDKIAITKLSAAQRQLDTAIQLWFAEADPVSIHTLASASHEIIHTLFKRMGHSGLLFDSPVIKPEHRSDVAKLIKSRASFFKHAQKDPDGAIIFNPSVNEVILLTCVHGLSRINANIISDAERVFFLWWRINNPQLFLDVEIANSIPVNEIENFRQISKREFFHGCLQILRKHRQQPMIG